VEGHEEQQNTLETLKQEIRQRLEKALDNPILRSRLNELLKELDKMRKKDYKSPLTDQQIMDELLASSARADNLIEFQEMLRQLASHFNRPKEWIEDTLAHENAHAAAALENGFEWMGYALLYIKNEVGEVVVQPFFIQRASKDWSQKELHFKNLQVLNAPKLYGHTLSSFDEKDIRNY
jgi:hypothetical protein